MLETMKQQPMTNLLHKSECPYDYQCLSTDCMECVKMHMEQGESNYE